MSNNNKTIIDTSLGKKNGQSKCPNCGSTDIALDIKTGKLRCNFCRYEYLSDSAYFINEDISKLKGIVIESATKDLPKQANSLVTIKCSSCGAEVVLDANDVGLARCHWCRNTLSINEQISNAAIPDAVLPFNVIKKDAKECVENFVGKRKFFAHPKFRKKFSSDNIMGLYLPYMIIDVNAHADFCGQAEKKKREYTIKVSDTVETVYDADLYWVERHFDILINNLVVESSQDKLKQNNKNTNNIINAIMPFDTENCRVWDANYLKGFCSEKRDLNVDNLKSWVNAQCQDISRYKAKEDMKQYDRGTNWHKESFKSIGQRWVSAYLPVWLYSYHQKKLNGKELLHYVAVNGRTKKQWEAFLFINLSLLQFLQL